MTATASRSADARAISPRRMEKRTPLSHISPTNKGNSHRIPHRLAMWTWTCPALPSEAGLRRHAKCTDRFTFRTVERADTSPLPFRIERRGQTLRITPSIHRGRFGSCRATHRTIRMDAHCTVLMVPPHWSCRASISDFCPKAIQRSPLRIRQSPWARESVE